jgi:3,4-dihydroxy-2-butanone 4-phosphate synthase
VTATAGTEPTSFAAIEAAIAAVRAGEIVIVVDDEDRQNQGDLVMAAQHVNASRRAAGMGMQITPLV